jgi:hypothetical protein
MAEKAKIQQVFEKASASVYSGFKLYSTVAAQHGFRRGTERFRIDPGFTVTLPPIIARVCSLVPASVSAKTYSRAYPSGSSLRRFTRMFGHTPPSRISFHNFGH